MVLESKLFGQDRFAILSSGACTCRLQMSQFRWALIALLIGAAAATEGNTSTSPSPSPSDSPNGFIPGTNHYMHGSAGNVAGSAVGVWVAFMLLMALISCIRGRSLSKRPAATNAEQGVELGGVRLET